MHVEIHTLKNGADALVGRLRLDGSRIAALPPDHRLLMGILAESVYDPQTDAVYDAEYTPGPWLRLLHQQYRSAYLRASAPIEDEDGTAHRFASTQFDLADAGYSRSAGSPLPPLQKLQDGISDADLAADGKEGRFHITVKYGLHTDSPEDVRRVVGGWLARNGSRTVRATLGGVTLFPGDEYDVVKIDVDSDDLRSLNHALSSGLEYTDTHPTYNPHVTLAYVKPGLGGKYVGAGLDGYGVLLHRLIFSDRNKQETVIDLWNESLSGPPDDGGESLANHYADLWNIMREHGEDVTHEHLHDAAEELRDTHWRVTQRPDDEWVAHHWEDGESLRAWKGHGPAVAKESGGMWDESKHPRAPKGGASGGRFVSKGGVFRVNMWGQTHVHQGGQWVPVDFTKLSQAGEHKLQRALGQAQHTAKMQRVRRGDLDVARLQAQLQPHARELSGEEHWRADRELHALHNYHGALTPHRIEQLTQQQQGFLNRANLTAPRRRQIESNLARLHQMVVLARAKGLTGKVPEELVKQAAAQPTKRRPTPADYHARAPKAPSQAPKVQPAAETPNAPMSPEQAAKALAQQAAHVAQPKEGTDAASALNRQLIAEGKPKPVGNVSSESSEKRDIPPAKPAPARPSVQDLAQGLARDYVQHLDQSRADKDFARILKEHNLSDAERDELKQEFRRRVQGNGERKAVPESEQTPARKPKEDGQEPSYRDPLEADEDLRAQTEARREKLSRSSEKDRRRYWSDEAFRQGIKPKDLHAAAETVLNEDRSWREGRQKLLKRARDLLAHYGYNAQALTTNLRSGHVEDEVKGLDVVADSLQRSYPEQFAGHEDDPAHRLMEMFEEGVPRLISEDAAYEKAFEYLRGQRAEREPGQDEEEEGNRAAPLWDDEEDDPFGPRWKSLREWLRKSRHRQGGTPELVKKDWDSAKHPRAPKGGAHGGEFALKEGGGQASGQDGQASGQDGQASGQDGQASGQDGNGAPSSAGGETPKKSKFGKSRARVVLDDLAGSGVPDVLDAFFGNAVTINDVASLIGAPDDAEVTLVQTKHGNVLVKVWHPDYDAVRLLARDQQGQIYIQNQEFWVHEDRQGAGLGTEVFGRQVENAIEAGIAYIQCHAAKENPQNPKNPHNGYYTWPRFGYDQSLDDFDEFDAAEFRLKKAIRKNFPGAESILDVMAMPEGREWWKKNGGDLFHARFDLAGGSRSRQIFDAYLEERAHRPMPTKGYTGMHQAGKRPHQGIEEIALSADDERWLEAAWERLDRARAQDRDAKNSFVFDGALEGPFPRLDYDEEAEALQSGPALTGDAFPLSAVCLPQRNAKREDGLVYPAKGDSACPLNNP